MSWGPVDRDWGEGWENFDIDPFADDHTTGRETLATVTRLPRRRSGRRGDDLERSITAPRPTRPTPAARPGRTTGRTAPVEPAIPAGPGRRRVEDPVTARAARRARTRVGDSVADLVSTLEIAPRAGGGGGGGRSSDGDTDRGPTGGGPRSTVVKGLLALLVVAVIGQLVKVQLFEADRYTEVGEEQRLRTIPLDASRGRILDREGHDLALSVLRPSIVADPSLIEDPAAVAQQLATTLGIPFEDLIGPLSDPDSRFAYIDRRVDDDAAARVVELELPGVSIHQEPTRYTPSGDLARSIVGDVDTAQVGTSGLELVYDDLLTGTPGELSYERARDGGTIASAEQTRVPAQPGSDLVLTLDRSLQFETERALRAHVGALNAKGGTVVIAQPETGEILAMANITRDEDGQVINAGANRAVVDVFEPGSVNKVITIAAALEEGIVEPDSTRIVPDRMWVSDHEFSDDHGHPTAPMTVTNILSESSNIGTIMLAQELGKHRVDEYLRDFGFGEPTALNFPFESGGIMLDPANWSGTSIGTIPIGQGIAVTSLQMLSAYNVIANDGVYVPPRLVEATVDGDGNRTAPEVGEERRVVSEETAAQVREMLAEVVETGTGTQAQVPGYRVGGKTGTARKPQEGGGYEDEDGNYHYVAGFTGMVPIEDPQLTVIVIIDEPTGNIYGGTAAAPLFAELSQFALSRLQIPPTAAVESETAAAPN